VRSVIGFERAFAMRRVRWDMFVKKRQKMASVRGLEDVVRPTYYVSIRGYEEESACR